MYISDRARYETSTFKGKALLDIVEYNKKFFSLQKMFVHNTRLNVFLGEERKKYSKDVIPLKKSRDGNKN